MGAYINPPGMTKEMWLQQNATECTGAPEAFDERPGELFVCLVRNSMMFSAAAICFDEDEHADFIDPEDPRPKAWFSAPIEKLLEVSNLQVYLDVAEKRKAGAR